MADLDATDAGDQSGHLLESLATERARSAALRAEVAALRSGLAQVGADVTRIAESSAWRWGHAAARTFGRVRGRRFDTGGAIASALERIAALEVAHGRRQPSVSQWSFCLKIAAPSWEVAPAWGDLHLAEALARELERRGHRAMVQVRPEWEDAAGLAQDVAVVLRGRGRYLPKPGQLNVLWLISHPDELAAADCERYDLVCVASKPFAATLAPKTSAPVMVLEQATDERRFFPDPRPGLEHELVFVGNARGVRRKLLEDLLPTSRDLAVYGKGWEGVIAARQLVADHVPNEQLRHIYSSAGVVLNDHWDDMRAAAFVSNRLYDAVACGALVISDRVTSLERRFGGAVVSYESRDELHQLIEHFLAHPEERVRRGAAGRRLVLESHTFTHRADALLKAIGDLLAGARTSAVAARRV